MSSWKIWLLFALAPLAFALATRPAGAVTNGSARADDPKWDRRNINGLWLLAGGGLDDSEGGNSGSGAQEAKKDLADDWGFDTRPQLKGAYLREYQRRREADRKAHRDFMVTCKPNGMPSLTAGPYADEILQNDKQINWFQEFPGETWRIYLDGRPHPNPAEYPATLSGHSTGKWDGDTLVVETVNIRTDTLLFGQGRSENHLGHSDKMRIVQRIRLLDRDHLQIKGTVEDPEALVTPWLYTLTYHRHPGEEIVEYLCDDNNRESSDPKTGQEITEIPPRRNLPKPAPGNR